MTISLVEVAGASFRTDEKSDALNTDFMGRLHMRGRFLPARLAIARSLAMPVAPELLADNRESGGRVIKGDTLFGTGTSLMVWTALIVERAGDSELDIKALISLVGAHWRRGLELLDKEWTQSDGDITGFVKRLIEVAEVPLSFSSEALSSESGVLRGASVPSTHLISVPVGEIAEDMATKESVIWSMNGRGGSPHSAIMGGVGSGKTRTAVAMLEAIRSQINVPLIAFDFKGDLGTDASGNGYQIDVTFGAEILEPPRKPIPLDVLAINGVEEVDVSEAAMRFRESFGRLKSGLMGDRQRPLVLEAAKRALTEERPCQLYHILNALLNVYSEHEAKEDGAIGTMREICEFPLFEPRYSPVDFFQRSWIVKLPPNVPRDSRTIVVNLILDALNQYLNGLAEAETGAEGARALRVLCVVDEAHQILGTKLPALSNLIRMSRSKGGAIMLISQSPDDFSGEDDEFLSEMGLVVAFSTNAPPRNASRILGRGANLVQLGEGECFVKLRGDRTAKRTRAW